MQLAFADAVSEKKTEPAADAAEVAEPSEADVPGSSDEH